MAENEISGTVAGEPAPPEVRIVAANRGIVIVSVAGDLDAFSAPVLGAALDRIWAGNVRRMTLDLSRVEFVGVSALRTFLRASATARQQGAVLRLAANRDHLVRLLTFVGLGELVQSTPEARAEAAEQMTGEDPAARGCTADPATWRRERIRLPRCPTG